MCNRASASSSLSELSSAYSGEYQAQQKLFTAQLDMKILKKKSELNWEIIYLSWAELSWAGNPSEWAELSWELLRKSFCSSTQLRENSILVNNDHGFFSKWTRSTKLIQDRTVQLNLREKSRKRAKKEDARWAR